MLTNEIKAAESRVIEDMLEVFAGREASTLPGTLEANRAGITPRIRFGIVQFLAWTLPESADVILEMFLARTTEKPE